MFRLYEFLILISLILLVPSFPLFAAFFCLIECDWSPKNYCKQILGLFGEIRHSFNLLME